MSTLVSTSMSSFSPRPPIFPPQALSHATMALSHGFGGIVGSGRAPADRAPSPGTTAPARPPLSAQPSASLQRFPRQLSHFEHISISPPPAPTAATTGWEPPPPPTGTFTPVDLAGATLLSSRFGFGAVPAYDAHAQAAQSLAPAPSEPPPSAAAAVAAVDGATAAHMVQRLTNQNSRLREAWESERKHLEANRKRAEEVYREEWAIMDEFRVNWEVERATMAARIRDLTTKARSVEQENKELRSLLHQVGIPVRPTVCAPVPPAGADAAAVAAAAGSGPLSPPSVDITSAGGASSIGFRLGSSAAQGSFPRPALGRSPPDAAAAAFPRRPMVSPVRSIESDTVSPPPTQAETSPFAPLASQSDAPRLDFLPSPRDEMPIPIIDVQTLHPELEGIPIRATAVQKSTFTGIGESSKSSSKPASPTDQDVGPAKSPAKSPPKQQTVEALSAKESHRLTMHAGHTPSHSLSMMPSAAASTIADPSQGSTPTQAQISGEAGFPGPPGGGHQVPMSEKHQPVVVHAVEISTDEASGAVPEADPEDLSLGLAQGLAQDDIELHEPADDAPLKAPLMIRNIPAKDEEFWRLVNAKLEPISRGENATPTVVENPTLGSRAEAARRQGPYTAPEELMTGAKAKGADGEDDDASDNADGTEAKKEEDIPIRFKKTSNFGLPFGEI